MPRRSLTASRSLSGNVLKSSDALAQLAKETADLRRFAKDFAIHAGDKDKLSQFKARWDEADGVTDAKLQTLAAFYPNDPGRLAKTTASQYATYAGALAPALEKTATGAVDTTAAANEAIADTADGTAGTAEETLARLQKAVAVESSRAAQAMDHPGTADSLKARSTFNVSFISVLQSAALDADNRLTPYDNRHYAKPEDPPWT